MTGLSHYNPNGQSTFEWCGRATFHHGTVDPGWYQGGRSCAKARGSLAEKFGFRAKILSPNICYFVTMLKSVAIYAHFGNLWAQKGFWGQKQCCLGKKSALIYGMYCTYTELNVQICNYEQKQRICRQNRGHALDESFYGHLCLCRMLLSSAPWLVQSPCVIL